MRVSSTKILHAFHGGRALDGAALKLLDDGGGDLLGGVAPLHGRTRLERFLHRISDLLRMEFRRAPVALDDGLDHNFLHPFFDAAVASYSHRFIAALPTTTCRSAAMFSLPLPFAITKGVDPLFAFVFSTGFPQVIHHRNHNILCFAVPRADTYSTRETVRVQSNKMCFSAPEKNRINFDVWSMSRLKVVNDVGSRENRLRLKRDLQAVGARLMGSWGATDRASRTSRARGRAGRAAGSPRPAA